MSDETQIKQGKAYVLKEILPSYAVIVHAIKGGRGGRVIMWDLGSVDNSEHTFRLSPFYGTASQFLGRYREATQEELERLTTDLRQKLGTVFQKLSLLEKAAQTSQLPETTGPETGIFILDPHLPFDNSDEPAQSQTESALNKPSSGNAPETRHWDSFEEWAGYVH